MKKIFNFLLVLVMMFVIVPAVSADEVTSGRNTDTRGSITITNAVKGETYSIYKIFDLESFDTTKPAYAYKVSEKWTSYFAEGAEGLNYFDVSAKTNDSGTTELYVTLKEGADVKEFAEKALAYATATSTKIATDGSTPATDTTVEFTDLDLGYYLVDSTVGQLCMLDTTDPDKKITEKNGTPDIKKTAKTAATGDTPTVNSRSIGDTVTYTITLENVKGIANLGFVDTMTEGLTLNKTFTVFLTDGTTTKNLELGEDYTVTYPESGYTFVLGIEDAVTAAISNKNATITVTYSAVVNNSAAVNDPETNTAKIVYGDTATPKGTPVEVKTYVHEFSLIKSDGTTNYLAGATFKLYSEEACENQVYVTLLKNGHYQVSTTSNDTLITSVATAYGVIIEGLANGTYYLKEINPPVGYNKLATPIKVEINAANDGKETAETTSVTVINTTGAVLPSTGGIGTILFVVIGSILALGFGIVLITKFRMSKVSA